MTKKSSKKGTKKSTQPRTSFKFEVLHEKFKIVLPIVILKKKILDPQLDQTFKPIQNIFCTFLLKKRKTSPKPVKFCIKIKNRPTYCDFEKKNLTSNFSKS